MQCTLYKDRSIFSDVAPSQAKKWRIRLLFLAVLVVFCGQYFVMSEGFGEPYPAIMMPGFKGSGALRNGQLHITQMEADIVFRDGWHVVISRKQLLDEFSTAIHNSINRPLWALANNPAYRKDEPLLLRYRLFPSLQIGRRQAGSAESRDAIHRWLGQRIKRMFPDRDAKSVTMRWTTRHVSLGTQLKYLSRRRSIGHVAQGEVQEVVFSY